MSLVSELRRRNVFRMAVLYIVAAWLVMQVAEVVISLASLPAWAGAVVLSVLAIGFPIVLVLSWFYELTPQGLAREKDVAREDSITRVTGRRIDFIVIALLAAAVVVLAVHTWWPTSPMDRSIAVLSFENMSDDPEQEYFSDGIAEELLNTLARVDDLHVISRSSSFSFKGKKLDIPTIAKRLNVAHVLEGSVRRMGNSVRITAQLVDAGSDAHVWSETYDRELTAQNIFAIQSEIASAIADRLQASLSSSDQAAISSVPTLSLEAYQAYLLGKQRMINRTSISLEQAVGYFRKSIEADPSFALAYVALAETYMLLGEYAGLSLEEMLSNAEPAIGRALELDSRLAPAYAARGAVRSKAADLAASVSAFQRALELDPNYSRAYHWYGDVMLNYLRQPDAALPLLETAYSMDPVSPALIVTVGQALAGMGRFDEALNYYQKALEIEPSYASSYFLIGILHAHAYGRVDLGVKWSLEAAARDPRYVNNLRMLGLYYLALGDEHQAEYWINRALAIGPDRHWPNVAAAFLNFRRGNAEKAVELARRLQAITPGNNTTIYMLVAHGHYDEALRNAATDYPEFTCNDEPGVTRANLLPAINVSLALEATGNVDCGSQLLDGALRVMSRMPRRGLLGFGFADAEVHARLGNKVRALDALRQGIDEGWRMYWWTQGELSPHMTSVRDEPRFLAMMDEIRADMSAQLAGVRELEADGGSPSDLQ